MKVQSMVITASLVTALASLPHMTLGAEAAPGRTETTTVARSGIKTDVQRTTDGQPLNDEDFRHLSVLGSHVLNQIDRARRSIDGDNQADAKAAIEKAQKVAGIIRNVLPHTHVTTTVTGNDGKTLYQDTDDVQANRITVFRFLTEINVTRPLIETKKKVSEVAGQEYEGTGIVSADVSINLGFVERRLHEAAKLLANNMAGADEALAEAQAFGTSLSVAEAEFPLDEAREALHYAHESAKEKRYSAASANLRVARGYLNLYREVAPENNKEDVASMDKEIAVLADEIKHTNDTSHAKHTSAVKGLYDKVTGLWRGSSHNPKSTHAAPAKNPPAKATSQTPTTATSAKK